MYKYELSLLPNIFDMFTHNNEIHSHNTRQSEHIHLPLCRSNLTKKSMKYLGPKIWNKFIANIDVYCCIGTFKKLVKTYISTNSPII